MPFYVAREAPKVSLFLCHCFFFIYALFIRNCFIVKLWRKICTETSIEVSFFADNWKLLLAGVFFQVHSLII
jgi:hypothetical protein